MAKRSAKVIPMPVRQRLVCSECGADGEGTCRCGAPYVPPGDRAAEAIKANPGKSNRTIAKAIGTDEQTVRAARQTGTAGHPAVVEAQGLRGPDGVIRRQGLDGKWRKLPVKAAPPPKAKKSKPANTSTGNVHQQVTALYMELKNFSNDFCARLACWLTAHPGLDAESKVGLTEVLEDTAMGLQRLAQAIDDR